MTQVNSDSFMYGWGWILWLGFVIFMFSGLGNWNYAYRAHRRIDSAPVKDATAILKQRYAAGELTRTQYLEMLSDITVS